MAIGIITEYNPFHNGHWHHIQSIRKRYPDVPVIAVMSGHFMQRGGPAICDKWTRAEIAVRHGIDLVLELPLLYASQSAEIFAMGAIRVLNATGCVDTVVFGSENNDIDWLIHTAHTLSERRNDFEYFLKTYLKEGHSFALARNKAASHLGITLPEYANDILGIEYIRQIITQKSTITPVCIPRIGTHYNSLNFGENLCSATAIRKHLSTSVPEHSLPLIRSFIPQKAFSILTGKKMLFEEDFFENIRYTIIRNYSSLNDIFEIGEGLEHLIYSKALSCTSFVSLSESIKSKRYTMTRIRRILYNILLDIRKENMQEILSSEELPYLRVLAFNDTGRICLKNIKIQSAAPLVNKVASFAPNNTLQKILFEHDLRATQIYHLRTDLSASLNMDYISSPRYISNTEE